MPDVPHKIYVPSYDDYEGGPFSPAFTSRETCEQYIAELAAMTNNRVTEYDIEEWPLLDRMPSRVPFHQRTAHVHWDGYVCPGGTRTMDQWDFIDFKGYEPTVSAQGSGVRVSVWVKAEPDLDAAYEVALAEAHAQALAATRPVEYRCGTECTHPAFRVGGPPGFEPGTSDLRGLAR